METNETKALICDTCQTSLQIKKAEITDLDINRISLLSMFSINNYYLVQCPECKVTGLRIG